MDKIPLDKYKELVKKERKRCFKQPYDLVYENFIKLGYDKREREYFKENASFIVEELRCNCWNDYQPIEQNFTSDMLKKLIDKNYVSKLDPVQAITWFAEEFPKHIYALTLSNTQSRRSRAGKEFETIIELILMGAGIPMDSQGNIGKQEFINKGLGKLVDVVSPGVLEYIINKRNVALISAKTTLRERWQEVPEEMGRTGAREMFLATIDENISKEVLDTLYEANIQVITTRRIKNECYKDNNRVLDFEELIGICLVNADSWKSFNYTVEHKELLEVMLNKQIEKHERHRFVKDFYRKRLDELKKTLFKEGRVF